MSTELTVVSPGVARLAWSAHLRERGIGAASKEIRQALATGFSEGTRRIELLVDPDDTEAQRIATFSGLMREGIARGVLDGRDRIVYARLADDVPVEQGEGFRTLLNSFLPRKRAIGQLLIRDHDQRVLLCELTYKPDHDLPGGVVEMNESPRLAVSREVSEELDIDITAGELLLTDWLPPWSGWDDAVCLVFDGGEHDARLLDRIVREEREIRAARFHTIEEARELCADFTARRVEVALANLDPARRVPYTESGHPV